MLSPRNHEEKSRHSRYRSCWWIQDHHIVAPSGQRSKGSFFFGKQNKTMPDKKHQTNDTSTKKTMITWPEEPTLKGIGNNSYRLHNRRSTKSGHKNYIWIHINIFSETYRKLWKHHPTSAKKRIFFFPAAIFFSLLEAFCVCAAFRPPFKGGGCPSGSMVRSMGSTWENRSQKWCEKSRGF